MTDFAPLMALALEEARAAALRGEVPVGAVVSDSHGRILACNGNRTLEQHDATSHAEMLAIRAACRLTGNERLSACTLYVTLEPCAMCAAAIAAARIRRLIYGAPDAKSGGVEHGARIFAHEQTHHRPQIISGVRETECALLLRNFFAGLR